MRHKAGKIRPVYSLGGGDRGLRQALRRFFVLTGAWLGVLLLLVLVSQLLQPPLVAGASARQILAVQLYFLLWALVVLACLVLTWTWARAPSGVVASLLVAGLGFGWLLERGRLAVSLLWLLAMLMGLLALSAAVRVERVARREDRRETRRLVRALSGYRARQPLERRDYQILYGDARGQLVPQRLQVAFDPVWMTGRVTLPDGQVDYVELPRSAIRQLEADEERRLVRIVLVQPVALELRNLGLHAMNDPAPRYTAVWTRCFASSQEWQAFLGQMESYSQLAASPVSVPLRYYVLRHEGNRSWWYGDGGGGQRQGPAALRPLRDEEAARARLAELIAESSGAVYDVVALDPDLPLLDDLRMRTDQAGWLAFAISTAALVVLLLPELDWALRGLALLVFACLAASEGTRQFRRGRHRGFGIVAAVPALLALGIHVGLG
ncbi:MAG: hypothetical protein QM296_02875 [Bacillota bacterium]|nr:hypothetical protein [Bacillota bacterium]